ncbi:MAG: hypothetical protein ABI807_04345 [Sporichthyaceae bacterium]
MSARPQLRPVRLRLTWRQRRAFVLTVLGYQVLVWGDYLLLDGRFGGGPRTALAGAALLLVAGAMWWVGTSATRRGLVVHALPPMTIPWAEVREIEVRTQVGRKVVVVHHGRDLHRTTTLSAPFTGPISRDDDFQDKVRALRSYWAAHRESTAA